MPESAGQIPEWTLGWRMQRSLAHAGVAVEEIADEMGVSRSTVSRWLNDRGAAPKAAYVKLWSLRTGVPYEWLAGADPTGRGGQKLQPTPKHLIRAGLRSTSTPTLRFAA